MHIRSTTRYLLFLTVFLVSLMLRPSLCSADFSMMECPLTPPITITSPYGYRDPSIGVSNGNHQGIDMVSESGDNTVYAVADGEIVEAGPAYGYGLWVVIHHDGPDGGFYATYGDVNELLVDKDNDIYVTSGTPIARYGMGDGQISTGAHLHFQISLGGYSNGGLDPAESWAYYAPWLNGNYSNTLHESAKIKFDVEAFLSFTNELQKILDQFAEACVKGIDLLMSIIYAIIGILMTIDFAITYILDSIDSEKSNSSSYSIFKVLVLKALLYCFLFFFITHWGAFIGNGAKSFFVTAASLAAGSDPDTAAKTVSSPFFIISRGAHIVSPMFEVLNNASRIRPNFLTEIVKAIPVFFFLIIILMSFVLFTYQICIAYLEFFFTILFSFANFMWAGLRFTRKYAANGLGAIFCVSAKLFFFIFFALMMQNVIHNLVIEDLVIEVDDGVGGEVSAHSDGNFGSVEEIAKSIVWVESTGRYDVYNSEGSGCYGAYQQDPQFWDDRCAEYEAKHPGETLCRRDSADNPQNAPNTIYGWCKDNQDKVSLDMMRTYYEESGGDYRYICTRWFGASSDEYWQKVCNAQGSLLPGGKRKVLNYTACLKITLFAILFVILGDKIGILITKTWGKGGFIFVEENT